MASLPVGLCDSAVDSALMGPWMSRPGRPKSLLTCAQAGEDKTTRRPCLCHFFKSPAPDFSRTQFIPPPRCPFQRPQKPYLKRTETSPGRAMYPEEENAVLAVLVPTSVRGLQDKHWLGHVSSGSPAVSHVVSRASVLLSVQQAQ